MSGLARRAASAMSFLDHPPQISEENARTWIMRGANFVVALSEVGPGGVLSREDDADEYVVLALPGQRYRIECGDGERALSGDGLTIVPPGASRVSAQDGGLIARVFTHRAADLAGQAANSASYKDGAPEVAPLSSTPSPLPTLRHYAYADYAVAERMQPRSFRTACLMINVFSIWDERRDPQKLSPHSHDDFEQCSLTLAGDFLHHLRYPWGANMTEWRADEDVFVRSPSALVIPANVIHTTRDIGIGPTWLIDIFAPARADFLARDGFVRNAGEYPA